MSTQHSTDTWINGAEDRLCGFLANLIRFDTSNPPGRNYGPCAEYLAAKLRSLGFDTVIHQVPEAVLAPTVPNAATHPRFTVVGRWDVGAPKTVHFNAHYDVVPTGPGWTSPPFSPEIRKGWLYGRGANDMKGSIASLCTAVEAVQTVGLKPKMNVEIAFVPDEESNSLLGTGYLVEQKWHRADYAVVCEGGFGDMIGCGHNGVIWMEVTVKGKSAHASRPHLGVNAFEMAAALCQELGKYKTRIRRHVFTAPGGEKMRPPLTLGGEVRGNDGAKINTIPDEFTFTIDRRVLPDETVAQVEKELRATLREACKKIPGLKIEVRKISSRKASLVKESDPLPREFLKTVRHYRKRAGFGMTSGFTDMAFYANEARLPCVGYGVEGKNTHGIDECVKVADLVKVAKIYARFLTTAGL